MGTKEQCIDKAKELLDILAPGGRYWFDFDKGALTPNSVNIENLKAVLAYVHENTVYPEYQEHSIEITSSAPPASSFSGNQYYTSWEEYHAAHPEISKNAAPYVAPILQSYEDMVFRFVTSTF